MEFIQERRAHNYFSPQATAHQQPDRPFALTCKLGIIEHDKAYSSRTVRKAEDAEDTQPALYGSFSLPLAKLIISHAITNSYVSIGELVLKLREGIPQGAKFSSILANLFLADFEDDFMSTFYRPIQKTSTPSGGSDRSYQNRRCSRNSQAK